jgi:hypothetical protein
MAETDETVLIALEILTPSSAKQYLTSQYLQMRLGRKTRNLNKPEPIKIKSARLQGNVLIINNGQVYIPFNERHSGEPSEETAVLKAFKTFKFLWPNRFEMEKNAIRNKKDAKLISFANLKRVRDCPTQKAINKIISSMKRFTIMD